MHGVWEEQAVSHVSGICFKTGPPRWTGVELEWLVRERGDPGAAVAPERLARALEPLGGDGAELPGGGRITLEPGGQVELSSAAAGSPGACVAGAAGDLGLMRAALARAGLELEGSGLDAHRAPRRVLEHPRYAAMEAHFDRGGPWGRAMMNATAAVQVSVDAGDEGEGVDGFRFRWELAHRLGPVLIAAFANSPFPPSAGGGPQRPNGWKSNRQLVWSRMDPGRTLPPGAAGGFRPRADGDELAPEDPAPQPGAHHDDPRAVWARYALDADVMCVRRPGPGASWSAPPGLSLRKWGRDGVDGERAPELDDLDYHLTTLFPPVRPRGWLELRMIDAQPGDGWVVPLVVAATLMDDPQAAAAAWRATEPLTAGRRTPPWGAWLRAARSGPADRRTGAAVRACFEAVSDALDRSGAPAELRGAVAEFRQTYPDRGRCPADDQLERWAAGKRLQPVPEGAAR
ncbi:ergothioneine biosynthesis glutamate--cysteine ligase EgtA [Streptomyces boninensis]|uniref:ergothioneine biosynthesis glutamate--cysteine ligase EgtA n=1 Tax=Streptomyces boninensis TaxID=2039455 RepID=UPI003B2166B6